MATKTIADYSKDYAAAKAKGDSAGMAAANKAANAIRTASGQATQDASKDIAGVASKGTTSTGSGTKGTSGSTYIPYTIGSPDGQKKANGMAVGESFNASDGSTWVKNKDGSISVTTKNGTYTPNAFQSSVIPEMPVMPVPTEELAYQQPTLNGQNLGNMYGLTYNYGDILNILNNATKANYAAQKDAFKQTENQFYRQMVDTQSTTLDTLRKAQAQAVATGASKGIAAANQLSSVLNLQDISTDLSTDLATERNLLNSKETAAYEQNASTALDTSNSIKSAIAGLDLNKYGYDVQQLIGKLDYLAAMDSSQKTLDGVKYNADQNLKGTLTAANFNGGTGTDKYYGGYTSNGSKYLQNGGTNATTPTGSKVVDGATVDFNAFIKSGDGAYAPKGSDIVVYKEPGGTYTISSPGRAPINGMTMDDVNKVLGNNNDLGALEAGYGSNDFFSIVNRTPVADATAGSKGQAELGTTTPTNNTVVTNPNEILKAGTSITVRGAATGRGGTSTYTYTYNAAKAVWESPSGNISVAEMNKRLKSGDYTKVGLTKP